MLGDLIQKVVESRESARESAWQTLRSMLWGATPEGKDKPEKLLANAIEALRLTPGQVTEYAALVTEAVALRVEADQLESRLASCSSAGAGLVEHDAETERLVMELRIQRGNIRQQMLADSRTATSAYEKSQRFLADLKILQKDHPHLFDDAVLPIPKLA